MDKHNTQYQLFRIKVKIIMAQIIDNPCCICHEELEENCVLFPCSHVLHATCIIQMRKHSGKHQTKD